MTDWLLDHKYGKKKSNFNYDRVHKAMLQYDQAEEAFEGGGGGGAVNEELSGGGGGKEFPKMETEVVDVRFSQNQCIIFTAEQECCLNELLLGLEGKNGQPFTSLVSGSPGAGKTSLAAELIENLAGSQPIVYLTESKKLRELIEKHWRNSPIFEESSPITFENYESLIKKFGILREGVIWVDDQDINRFYDQAVKQDLKKKLSFKQLKQEFGVMAMLASEADYFALSMDHSLFFKNTELKAVVWELWRDYREKLAQENKIHLGLHAFEVPESAAEPEEPPVDGVDTSLIIVDEAMDLSRSQLATLVRLFPHLILIKHSMTAQIPWSIFLGL